MSLSRRPSSIKSTAENRPRDIRGRWEGRRSGRPAEFSRSCPIRSTKTAIAAVKSSSICAWRHVCHLSVLVYAVHIICATSTAGAVPARRQLSVKAGIGIHIGGPWGPHRGGIPLFMANLLVRHVESNLRPFRNPPSESYSPRIGIKRQFRKP
jgi:hypothetical protein